MAGGYAGAGRQPSRSSAGHVKAPSWAEYWAFARVRLGLTQDEFFKLTPRMFAELVKQERERRREMATQIALLRMDVINFSMGRPKRPVKLEDLIAPEETPGRERKPKRLSAKRRQRIADRVRETMAAWPGGLIVKES